MTADLLHHALPIRLTGRDGFPDLHVEVFPELRADGELVAATYSGEGYYYLSRPFNRDPDGTLVALWAEDLTTTTTYEVEWESRPRLGSF